MRGIKTQVVIPFRDRGIDPRRGANLDVVMAWWYGHGFEPQIIDDGLSGDAQFNRHRAYNRAVSRNLDAEVFVFSEADMLIHPEQIKEAVRLASQTPGLVVPFKEYRYLSDNTTGFIRSLYKEHMTSEELAEWFALPVKDVNSVFEMRTESVMKDGKSIGAVNVVSRETLRLTGGFTEATSGNWYDDNIIEEGFAYLTGRKTRWVGGPAMHLYHLPGWKGAHLTTEDKAATQRNKRILNRMRLDIRNGHRDAVKNLMEVRRA